MLNILTEKKWLDDFMSGACHAWSHYIDITLLWMALKSYY